jgi:polyhydroxybutyrate depolymerase
VDGGAAVAGAAAVTCRTPAATLERRALRHEEHDMGLRLRAGLCVLAVLQELPFACRAQAPTEPAALPSAAPQRLALQHGGRERAALLADLPLPSGAPEDALRPIVLVLHGGGGSGEQMRTMTRAGFERLLAAEGGLVAYPDGWERQWNDGRRDPPKAAAFAQDVDDVGFLRALVARLVQERGGDGQRVYATGHSNGALLCWRLAALGGDFITAIAPNCGLLAEGHEAWAWPRPVPVLLMVGEDDPMIPAAGGPIGPRLGGPRGRVHSLEATIAHVAACNGLAAVPATVELLPDRAPRDGTRIERRAFAAAPTVEDAAPAPHAPLVVLLTRGGGHTWAGGDHGRREWLIGEVSTDADACELAWDFVRGLRRR